MFNPFKALKTFRQTVLTHVMDPVAGAGIFAGINLIMLVALLRQCSQMSLLTHDVREIS